MWACSYKHLHPPSLSPFQFVSLLPYPLFSSPQIKASPFHDTSGSRYGPMSLMTSSYFHSNYRPHHPKSCFPVSLSHLASDPFFVAFAHCHSRIAPLKYTSMYAHTHTHAYTHISTSTLKSKPKPAAGSTIGTCPRTSTIEAILACLVCLSRNGGATQRL